MAKATYLVDTSVLARMVKAPVAERVAPLINDGLLATCPVTDLELLFSARSGEEHRARKGVLADHLLQYPYAYHFDASLLAGFLKTWATSRGVRQVLDAQPARGHGVLSSVIRHEMAERLELSVGRLPTSMREAFLLRYVDAMDYPEISSITGVSEGTARVRAFRARALLRGELGDVVDTVWLEKDEAP